MKSDWESSWAPEREDWDLDEFCASCDEETEDCTCHYAYDDREERAERAMATPYEPYTAWDS